MNKNDQIRETFILPWNCTTDAGSHNIHTLKALLQVAIEPVIRIFCLETMDDSATMTQQSDQNNKRRSETLGRFFLLLLYWTRMVDASIDPVHTAYLCNLFEPVIILQPRQE